MHTSTRLFVAAVALGLFATGCVGDSFEDRLQTCGFLSEGRLGEPPLYAPDECYRACLGRATCEQLGDALCGRDISLQLDCDAECAFRCDDGPLIAVENVCNGRRDCAGGEDEAECESFACGVGEAPGRRCDGRVDCMDESDEAGCFGTIDCGEDSTRGRRYARVCDGWSECDDGRDEESCASSQIRCSSR